MSSPRSLAPRMKEGGSDAVPGTLPAPSSGPSQPAQIHRDPSLVLSLLLGASGTCIGPTRTFQNQWRGGALGLWSTQLFWVKLNPASASPTLQKGKQRPWIRKTLFLHSSGNPPCSFLTVCLASASPLSGLVGLPVPLKGGRRGTRQHGL